MYNHKPLENELTIWLGLHLDEWPNDQALEEFRYLPRQVLGLAVVTRNFAYYRNKLNLPSDGQLPRMVSHNMVTCFGPGHQDNSAEFVDAEFFRSMTGASRAWDIHGNNNDYDIPFYGSQGRQDKIVLGIASLLESDDALVCRSPHVAALYPGYVGWDLGKGSKQLELEYVPEIAQKICRGWVPPTRKLKEWVGVGALTKVSASDNGVNKYYQPFERLPDGIHSIIESSSPLPFALPLHALLSDDEYEGIYPTTEYHCEVVTPLQAAQSHGLM